MAAIITGLVNRLNGFRVLYAGDLQYTKIVELLSTLWLAQLEREILVPDSMLVGGLGPSTLMKALDRTQSGILHYFQSLFDFIRSRYMCWILSFVTSTKE